MPFSRFQYEDRATAGLEAIYRWAYRRGGARGLEQVKEELKDHIRAVQASWEPSSGGAEPGGPAGDSHEYVTPFAGGRFMLAFKPADDDPDVLVLGSVKEMPL